MDGLFGWGLTGGMLVACILLDYILAFTVLGIAGLFRKKGMYGWLFGITLALLLRFFFHVASGYFIWHSFGELWSDFFIENSLLYSLAYNACYMVPELVFTLIGAFVLFSVPATKKYLVKCVE